MSERGLAQNGRSELYANVMTWQAVIDLGAGATFYDALVEVEPA